MTGSEAEMPQRDAVTVRYWAAARAAAGVDVELVQTTGPTTLAAVLAEARRRHPDARFAQVLEVCSVLVEDRPVGSREPADVVVAPGESVQVLPPFAGGCR